MEKVIKSRKIKNLFLGKKTKKDFQIDNSDKSEDNDKSLFLLETNTESLIYNIISLNEKTENENKIPGFDDVKIPLFLNDIKKDNSLNKKIREYNKIKEEFGSSELADLYLIDIKSLYEKKRYK